MNSLVPSRKQTPRCHSLRNTHPLLLPTRDTVYSHITDRSLLRVLQSQYRGEDICSSGDKLVASLVLEALTWSTCLGGESKGLVDCESREMDCTGNG
jgi:hypothetical protein